MARPQNIETDIVLRRLSDLFRTDGYEGASLARLADCAGLKKASLYHRFPGGKQQMAEDVLASAAAWLQQNVLKPLHANGPAHERLTAAMDGLEEFYQGGSRSCLLNILASTSGPSPFAPTIAAMFQAIISAFAKLAKDAGATPKQATRRAERCVTLLEGGLVMARGMNAPQYFKTALASLPQELGLTP
jgi:TetR/AcrR family transcriptional regulator, lmrAB and yxaGH operons repressor